MAVVGPLALVVLTALLALASCGGSNTTASASASAAPGGTSPAWTQQGAALVMATSAWGVDFASGSGIYVVGADGSGLSLVPGVNGAFDPAWRPEWTSP